jgi:hypothetical protein
MTAASIIAARASNRRESILDTDSSEPATIQHAIIDALRSICPAKTWAYIADLMCASEAVAKHRVACRRDFTPDEIAALLQGDHGFEVLKAMMGHARPAWWRALKRQHEIAALRRGQEEQRKLLERLEREAAE